MMRQAKFHLVISYAGVKVSLRDASQKFAIYRASVKICATL